MSAIVMKLIGVGVLLAAIAGGLLYVRDLRAELADANHQLDAARQGIADRDQTINQLQQDAKDKAAQQAQLDTATTRATNATTAIRQETRRILNENPTARAWADTALPDDIVRLQSSPALTGADDYGASVSAGDAVHAASDGAAH